MKWLLPILSAALLLNGCVSVADPNDTQPSVYPDTVTGTIEVTNKTSETYALALNRCGEENQGIPVSFNGMNGLTVPPNETVTATLSVGCYSGAFGPDRMSTSIKTVTFDIVPADEGSVKVDSDGRVEVVAAP